MSQALAKMKTILTDQPRVPHAERRTLGKVVEIFRRFSEPSQGGKTAVVECDLWTGLLQFGGKFSKNVMEEASFVL